MKRTGSPLTGNEKSMVISVYNYFSRVNFKTEDHQKVTLCKRVAEALGIAESTVGAVVADWNKRGDNTFTPNKPLRRPKLQPDENISEILCTKILNANKTAEQLSTHTLQQFLAKKGYNFSKWKLLRVVHQLGFYYVNFTPPYHCELQPIEGVWSVAKGEVARSGPHPNLLSVRNTLLNAFKEKISSKVIVGLWRRALKNAKEYFESDENIQLLDEEFDGYSSSDNDHVI
ncbi:hypothetical protein RclHR1_06600002 [Rhizophagus clarus]|uniref:Tc1-like transposase DDE domain-containing protein n=1 Tax=Rhizophagus clarus TaxID=94130 RepID=A0A2Z6RSE6_9GLOM|nr:hypothetical protein RclHR1_06600002 [Rhizophagus clarus]GES98440.1 hypothetical protein PPTG_14692 [Rhizophagus clarus]